jgi:membrane fusion protein, copper/silver efflux system
VRKALYAIPLLLAVALGFLAGHGRTQPASSRPPARRVLYYVDPMHPAYKSDKPGIAPDCGMQLEPVYADGAGATLVAASAPIGSDVVSIDPYAQQLLGIRVATVETTSATRTLRIPGRVAVDETRVYRINAGVPGFVKETYDDVVGSYVKKDQRLAKINSPEFASAIGGYLSASERPQAPPSKEAAMHGQASIQTWQDHLRGLGISDAQLQEITSTRTIPEDVYVLSPTDGFILTRSISPGQRFDRPMEFYRIADLSQVWIVADLFESEAEHIHPGAIARITLPDQRSFSARVSDVLPQIDSNTRTLTLRLEADNKDLALRPNMIVDVDLAVKGPSGLSVPAEAVVDSGVSKRVFVDRGNGLFEPRHVETGQPFGDRVQILSGLVKGERVVASGTFLVDSESRLRSAPEERHQTGTNHTPNPGSEIGEVKRQTPAGTTQVATPPQ